MKVTCPKCKAANEYSEDDYVPGSTNTAECWRCGEELSFTMPGVAPVSGSSGIAVNEPMAPSKREIPTAEASHTDADLEKAKLALEAERIKLEHRKIDHEREMSMIAQQRADSYSYDDDEVKPRKDKTTAGLLAIFLGGLGAHKFYLGKAGQGVLYLLFCWTYIPGILGLIEGIKYLTKNDRDFHANCY